VSAVLKERYSEGLSLAGAFGAALAALSASGNGERNEIVGTQLEVAILDRTRSHRTFRRIRAARLEELIAEARSIAEAAAAAASANDTPETPETSDAPPAAQAPETPKAPEAPSDSAPPTGPTRGQTDSGSGINGDTEPPL
jgi:proteasome alpha subunit